MTNKAQSRRSFLKASGAISGLAGLNILVPRVARGASPQWGGNIPGFGPLTPTASENTGEVLLELPPGLKYTVLGRTGQMMSDGRLTLVMQTEWEHSSTATKFASCVITSGETAPVIGDPAFAYDTLAGGGTTTLTVDPVTRLPLERFVSLSGTIRNCAGGVTPWGTWITCEETNQFNAATGKQHGYNFEVSAFANGEVSKAAPLHGLGLLYPEAVVIDPGTGIAYITMDRNPSGLFRFIPEEYGNLAGPGYLQMLAIDGYPQFNTAPATPQNVNLRVTWVDVTSPTPEAAYRADALVAFKEGLAQGGASFSRWKARGRVETACSSRRRVAERLEPGRFSNCTCTITMCRNWN